MPVPLVGRRGPVAAGLWLGVHQGRIAEGGPRPVRGAGGGLARKAAGRRRAADAGAGAVGGAQLEAATRVAVGTKVEEGPPRVIGRAEPPSKAGLAAVAVGATRAPFEAAGAVEGTAAVLVAAGLFWEVAPLVQVVPV